MISSSSSLLNVKSITSHDGFFGGSAEDDKYIRYKYANTEGGGGGL